MDEINSFFDFSKDFHRESVPRGCVSGNLWASAGKPTDGKPTKREYVGDGYAREVKAQERRRMMDIDVAEDVAGAHSSRYSSGVVGNAPSVMNDLEDFSENENDEEELDVKPKINRIDDGVYEKFMFNLQRDETLPIHDTKDQIISLIRKSPVVVLEGDTGCGKTTQVPQYILDDAFRRREYCNIICTQPRRIAAISIARRVCFERKWEEGSVVGYQVGLHANISEYTRLLYCTTGVLLQKLIREKTLTNYTHVILDEVHERDQDMDFLLIIIRRLLTSNSKNVKVILMSATINTTEFADYFKIRNNPAPIIRVDTRRLYQVREFYLCDLGRINSTNLQVDFSEPGISKEMYNIALKLVIVIDNIEKQEAAISLDTKESDNKTSILIFLPGINEIDQLFKRLDQLNQTDDTNVKMMPIKLHSLISPDEQVRIFHRAPPGFRKVILATNIAESSITVPDVKYVIDFCLTKCLVTDTSTNFTSLQLQWASRANCRQRSGRAGRLMNGRVYRMVPRNFYNNYLDEFGSPEMLRCPLENVVLKAKLLDMGSPPSILGLAMSPPNLSDIHNTILTLKEVGALYRYVGGVYSVQDGDLSFMGRVMAGLPLDIRLTRLIILGYVFSALEEAIIMAAGLSVRSIFKFSAGRRQDEILAYIQKLVWADGSGSDLFAILKAYMVWSSMREQHNIHEDDGEKTWAERFFINLRSMREMHLLVQEIKERLASYGIKETTAYQRVHWIDREKTIILKIIIAGAFYPNYFTRSNLNEVEQERNVYHVLCGNDPCNTVYFTNFNNRYIGQLYVRTIKDLFKDVRIPPKNIDVRFQPGSEKVFITFKSDPEEEFDDALSRRLMVPGRVRPEVYKAIKMRHVLMQSTIRVMDPRAGIRYAEERGVGVMYEGVWKPTKKLVTNPELVVLPSVFQKVIRGYITHIDNCSKFYFQPLSEMERLREIHALINNLQADEDNRFRNAAAISKGMLLAAPFNDVYHRAKVLQVIHASRQHLQFRVFFIDFGNTDIVEFSLLRRLSLRCESLIDVPPRVFECRLANVHPSTVKCPNGKWPDEAMELLQQIADAGVTELEVYSVVQGVSNVIVKMGTTTINDIMVESGFARKSDENYMSKCDHDFRLRKQSVANRFLDEDHSKQNEEYLRSIQPEIDLEVEPPPKEQCLKVINLRGPFSPLETKMFSAIRIGAWKSVIVERESVNSVLLDADPQDVHEHLIVAASITETANSETLTARATTIMPNIHGFGAFMTLIFCPTMQIKRNESRTKYVSVLAGLGHHEHTYEPFFEEHDIVLNLDADLLTDDLELINQLRYSMETILYTIPGEERPSILPNVRADLAAKIKNIIIRLLNKNRKFVETHIDANDRVWQRPEEEDVIETVQIYGKRSIFPMHSALRLYDEKFDRMHALGVHCSELHRLRQFEGSIQPITCQLCKQPLENIAQLRIHLLSQLHCDRENQIRFKMIS